MKLADFKTWLLLAVLLALAMWAAGCFPKLPPVPRPPPVNRGTMPKLPAGSDMPWNQYVVFGMFLFVAGVIAMSLGSRFALIGYIGGAAVAGGAAMVIFCLTIQSAQSQWWFSWVMGAVFVSGLGFVVWKLIFKERQVAVERQATKEQVQLVDELKPHIPPGELTKAVEQTLSDNTKELVEEAREEIRCNGGGSDEQTS